MEDNYQISGSFSQILKAYVHFRIHQTSIVLLKDLKLKLITKFLCKLFL